MLKTNGSGGIKSYNSVAKSYYSVPNHSVNNISTNSNHHFDSSSFSTVTDAGSRFQLEAVSRLSHEVRTSTTTGRIQELRQAVSSGEYQADPVEIAKRMMLLVEG